MIECEHDGKIYFHDGSGWFEKSPMRVRAHEALARILDEKCPEATEDHERLRARAVEAREARDYGRALSLIQRALSLEDPKNVDSLAILCSVLRHLNQPERAVNEVPEVAYSPVLTCLAAALCDLEQWENAASTIRRTLESDPTNPAAQKVAERIKNARPDLLRD